MAKVPRHKGVHVIPTAGDVQVCVLNGLSQSYVWAADGNIREISNGIRTPFKVKEAVMARSPIRILGVSAPNAISNVMTEKGVVVAKMAGGFVMAIRGGNHLERRVAIFFSFRIRTLVLHGGSWS